MTDEALAGQLRYYRRRAGEYDDTAYGDVTAARARIARLVAGMQPSGRVLEIACGTGLWTEALAEHAAEVTATDAAPEVIELARRRVTAPNVSFAVADVFAWTSPARYDIVFFSAWLSHVPSNRFAEFWTIVERLLAPSGRVLFIDEHVDVQDKESWVAGEEGVVERELRSGERFRIVKHFVDPDVLVGRLAELGWDCTIRRDGDDWVVGEARPRALPAGG